ncbi:alpha/beta hydrolase [Pedobacter frigiditerrae]|uniref:Alpha/beta hydrolase n=1 Tax=Pedobacter frigiditerrae TaxID=2530452 RepID=A0A4R0MQI0_9SPHI|nr:alpha/beta hydrolase [Pedobacter frigiditerrae]TCC88522.1 alpha/beta hydrolase [Pedobacter frigiditerrae]
MSISLKAAITAPNLFIATASGKIAYRTIGKGKPLLLCNRFRGTLDTWDPKFLAHLAKRFQVITFDYPGIGLSEGKHQVTTELLSKDIQLFIDVLGLHKVIIGGWSYGGLVVQSFAAMYPKLVSHVIIIGSNPLGENPVAPEQIFFDSALKPVYDFNDELILFFEPLSKESIAMAKKSHERLALRKSDLDLPVKPEQFENYFQGGVSFREDKFNAKEKLYQSSIPILVLMGDHDPSFAVENWFPLVKNVKAMQLIIFSKAGHGPQHQHPKLCADYIKKFTSNTK